MPNKVDYRTKDQDQHNQNAKRLTPTDIAQFIRLGECNRYLKLRLHERKKGSGFLRDFGVAPQSIPPLLTLSGQRFEERVEQAARQRFTVIRCGEALEDDDLGEDDGGKTTGQRSDNQLVVDHACALPAGGTLLLFQPRLEAVLGEWPFVGDVDILRLDRDEAGCLSALIVDMKSTTSAKLEHRLQVAFYHRMLTSIMINAGVNFARLDLGIIYRGPANWEPTSGSMSGNAETLTAAEITKSEAAQNLLGVPNALLEIIGNPEDYLAEVDDLVASPEAVVTKIARTRHADTFFHLSYKCDGCLYNEWCMKSTFQNDDLSLIPTLTASEKRLLLAAGIRTVAAAATLMTLTDELGSKVHLVPAPGQENRVRSLRASPLGPRLLEIVHRAKQAARSRRRELEKAASLRSEAAAEVGNEAATEVGNEAAAEVGSVKAAVQRGVFA